MRAPWQYLRGGFTPAPEEQLGMGPAEASPQAVRPASEPEKGPDPTRGDVGDERSRSFGSPAALSSVGQPRPPIRKGQEVYPAASGFGITPSPEQLEPLGWTQAWLARQPPASNASGPGDIDAAYDVAYPTWARTWPESGPTSSRAAQRGLDPEPDGD